MITTISFVLLLSAIHSQCSEYPVTYDSQYCSGVYLYNPYKEYFCSYLENFNYLYTKPFPTPSECRTCKEFLKRITWNEHTEQAVENLLKYTTKHFCEKVKKTTVTECKTKLKQYRPQMTKFLSKLMKNGSFCEVLLKCDENKQMMLYLTEYNTYLSDVYFYEFFNYFFNIENYSKDFYPYYFFNYFFQYQEYGYYPVSYLEFFYKDENYKYPLYFQNLFQNYYQNQNYEVPLYFYNLFQNYFLNQNYEYPPYFYNLLQYYFQNQNYGKDFYPYQFFEYLFNNQSKIFFNYHMEKNETLCSQCEKIPGSAFEQWSKSVDTKHLTEVGYTVLCNKAEDTRICRDLVDQTVVFIRQAISQALTKETVCYFMFRCPLLEEVPNYYQLAYNWEYLQIKPGNKKCTVCKEISKILNQGVGTQLFEEYVRGEFETTYCKKLFQNDNTMCQNFLKNHLSTLLTKMRSRLHEHLLCDSICHKPSLRENPVDFYNYFYQSPKLLCPGCEGISMILETILRSSGFENLVYKHFEVAKCKKLFPSTQLCKRYLVSNYSGIISKMVDSLERKNLCIPDCHSSNVIWGLPSNYLNYYQSEIDCDSCKNVIQVLEDLRPTKDNIKEYLNQLCLLPSVKKPHHCNVLLNRYKIEIQEQVLAQKSKLEICKAIKQCPSNPKFFGLFNQYLSYL